MEEIKFQITLPMLLKFLRSLDFAGLTCLLVIYLVIKFKKSLMFLESDARYLIDS